MEESFFGFDTSLPLEENGENGRIAEPSEEEYDALNDETFGSAVNGDWEEVHENLVRLTDIVRSPDAATSESSGGLDISKNVPLHSDINSRNPTPAALNADCDLEKYLANMKLDGIDMNYATESGKGRENPKYDMDPSVWSNQAVRMPMPSSNFDTRNAANPTDILQQQMRSPFQQQSPFNSNLCSIYGNHNFRNTPVLSPKICTLEDIERNLILHQTMDKQVQQKFNMAKSHEENCPPQQNLLNNVMNQTPSIPSPIPAQHNLLTQPQAQSQPPPMLSKVPPGFNSPQASPRGGNNAAPPAMVGMQHQQQQQQQHHLHNHHHQQQQQQQTPPVLPPPGAAARFPPGFPGCPPSSVQQHHAMPPPPPHPLLNQHGMQGNFQLMQRPMPNSHLPIALNNFAMHPNFNAMRPPMLSQNLLTQLTLRGVHPLNHNVVNPAQSNSTYNIFNMRLVQEIQQNHPLLQNTGRMPPQQHLAVNHQFQQQRNGGMKSNPNRWNDGIAGNGNLPYEEFDKYANLMSTRDKHWLIGIQLSQLNTDTPYIDDFYYTVYKERKAALSGVLGNSEAHKDNQLNHPLTQPRGHAQLVLVQMGNKNGTRNGQHRDRKNSDSVGNGGSGGGSGSGGGGGETKAPYVFTPLKFENSLGKLQYGSVTAPRKIIDADIMSNDTSLLISGDNDKSDASIINNGDNNSLSSTMHNAKANMNDMNATAQRKSRHILLHIETLYRILLKLEDLDNPNAIAAILVKKQKERERIEALEKLENANKISEGIPVDTSPQLNPGLKNKFPYEIETKDELMAKLLNNLNHEQIIAMMNIRKGKMLIKRIMPYIKTMEVRWNVWTGVFASLHNILKKDREDNEGLLYALFSDFRDHIKVANFEVIVKLSLALPINDKKANAVFCSKFGISSLVCLMIRAENLFVDGTDDTLTDVHKENWQNFLTRVASTLKHTIQCQAIIATIEPDSIQSLMNHLARFKDLKLDSLLALTTQAKQQIT